MIQERDYLWLNLRELPYFRALLRAVEARFYQKLDLAEPILDLGCGDGHFAAVAFTVPLTVGVDPWWQPLRQARRYHAHHLLVCGDGAHMPFPSGYFASAISNSVLEHITQVEAVLGETARLLRPGALFAFSVPNDTFLAQLSLGRFFDRLKLRGVGGLYRAFFNRISRHVHCDPPEVWEERLRRAGFRLMRWRHYFSPAALTALEWGHYLGLPSWLCHALSGRWILAPTPWNLALTRGMVERYYQAEPICDDGVYTFYEARREE